MEYQDSTFEELDEVMKNAWKAFVIYRKYTLKQRADFMREIANEIEKLGDDLIRVASEETHLPEPRLRSERARTNFQLKSYADACEKGNWMEVRIDTADSRRNPPRPDVRKTMVPLGPVIIFGASNFPFAYSTAGGDTACAFAAGCPVVVKAHPAHAGTSTLVASAIQKAAANMLMPSGIFSHVHGASTEVGKYLVEHPLTKAVAFTGSFLGGRQLFDWGNQRKEPIPVFAEMGSINPVFLLPQKTREAAGEIAKLYATSLLMSVGQFCTNPGLIIGIENDDLKIFVDALSQEIINASPGEMLHAGVFKNYVEKRANALAQQDVEMVAVSSVEPIFNQGAPTIASATAQAFINNPILHQEVFGPYSLVIRCRDLDEMYEVAHKLEGQLTCSVVGTVEEVRANDELIEEIKSRCGRLVMNGVPTGVEVCLSMQHGGPYPASTDSRFTAVGADGIKRFARPVSYQNWANELLPDELKDKNPLKIWRTVNNELKHGEI